MDEIQAFNVRYVSQKYGSLTLCHLILHIIHAMIQYSYLYSLTHNFNITISILLFDFIIHVVIIHMIQFLYNS